MIIITRQSPGFASFENFEEIKSYLAEQLTSYRNLVYTEDNLKLAKADKAKLNKLKKALDERRKELSINVIKKLCDGLNITLGEFFNVPLFNDLEQEIK